MTEDITADDRRLARILWDYHVLSQPLPDRVDLLLITGSHDLRVADRAAALLLEDRAPIGVASGGFGKVTSETNAHPEGELFRDRIVELGVDPQRILVEPAARNTGDNFQLTHKMLDSMDITPSTGIAVTKPYMERRAWATGTAQWPDVTWCVTSPKLGFDEYPAGEVTESRMIHLMVGDLQRIRVFADQGFQAPQEIPDEVWSAFEQLADRGYDQFIIRS